MSEFFAMFLPVLGLLMLPILIPMTGAAVRAVGKTFGITRRPAATPRPARPAAEFAG